MIAVERDDELLCEKLLAWERCERGGCVWWIVPGNPINVFEAQSFDTGDGMLMLMDALHRRGMFVELKTIDDDPNEFWCGIFEARSSDYLIEVHAPSLVAAVRMAALTYAKGLS